MDGAPIPPALQRAYDIQRKARVFLAQREQGRPADEDAIVAWMEERRLLAATEITAPLDGLAVAHQLLQSVSAIHRFSDDPVAITTMAGEIAIAASSLIQFLEASAGVTREEIGLFDDYGPLGN